MVAKELFHLVVMPPKAKANTLTVVGITVAVLALAP